MKEINLQLQGPVCEAQLIDARKRRESTDSIQRVIAEARIELEHPTSWSDLLTKVRLALHLDDHLPPGVVTVGDLDEGGESDAPRTVTRQAWDPVLCGFGIPGFGWGFHLPCLTESCCGFRDQAAASRAAKFLRHNLDVISGDLPNGVFEVFTLSGSFAFLDLHGEVHAGFSTHTLAQGCAAKLESTQMSGMPGSGPVSSSTCPPSKTSP